MNLKKRVPEPMQEMEGKEEVKAYFSSQKVKYKKKQTSYDFVAKNILKNIPLRKGKVLEVGCGYGGLLERLQYYRSNLSCYGIDLSNAMLKLAKSLNKEMIFFKDVCR
jgi:ubiquinone/menaquinone biosynthesis C-methylase UbiE